MYLQWNASSLNVNSFAFHVIKTLLQIVEAFQEPYYSHDTSLISIMYAKPDTFDSEDNVACSFLNLQIMHVLQYSRCLCSIKHLTKPAKKKIFLKFIFLNSGKFVVKYAFSCLNDEKSLQA